MLVITVEPNQEGVLRISGPADVHHALELHIALVSLVQRDAELVTLDLSELTEIDTAGAQILVALRRTVRSLRIMNLPEQLHARLESTGVLSLLA